MSLARTAGKGLLKGVICGMATGIIAVRNSLPHRGMPADAGTSALAAFRQWLGSLDAGTLLELGTRRVAGMQPTARRNWAPALRYIGCDFQTGDDVDVVADAEDLSASFPVGSIDAVIACSVFEHIRRPWLAAAEIGKVLRSGGRVFVQTHMCFPIHAHPHDYWRFTREALETLFCEENGFCQYVSWYDYPAAIISNSVPLAATGEAFLNVNLTAARM